MSEKGKFKEKYVTLDDLYWIMECIPDKRFTREEFDALEDEEYFVPASMVEQAKVEFPKIMSSDEYGDLLTLKDWFKKWFGGEKE